MKKRVKLKTQQRTLKIAREWMLKLYLQQLMSILKNQKYLVLSKNVVTALYMGTKQWGAFCAKNIIDTYSYTHDNGYMCWNVTNTQLRFSYLGCSFLIIFLEIAKRIKIIRCKQSDSIETMADAVEIKSFFNIKLNCCNSSFPRNYRP